MTFAHQYVHLTEQLQDTDRRLASPLFCEDVKVELRKVRLEVIEERNTLMDAIELGVVDDSEGI